MATRLKDPESASARGPEALHSPDREARAIPLRRDASEPLVRSAKQGDPHTVIEPGKSLVIADFGPPSLGAAERFMRFAYRMGLSGSFLAAPLRKPARPRLLATVESPLVGDRVAGVALRAGHFLIHGVKAPIAQIDFAPGAHLTPPFERMIHGFDWLQDLAASGPREQCTATAERVLVAWLDANPDTGKGAAWTVEHAAQRLLNWLVHAPLILSAQDKRLKGRVLDAIAETARWLDRNATSADDRLGECAAWAAVTAAGLLLPEGKARRLYGEAGLLRVLGELVGDDGGVLSRSPVAQMDAIALLVRLSACYEATRRDPPQTIPSMLALMVPPLLALLHGDGSLGNWQGAGAISRERIEALVTASGVRARPLSIPRQWGYQRLAARGSVLQFDAAPPPLARHARAGCAGTLAFEFSHAGHRLIVNCGGAALAGGQVPHRIEQGLRATAAHSTLVLDDTNSTAVLMNGKLGQGVTEVELDRRTVQTRQGAATRIEASHDGYASRFGLTHRRILIMREDGTELRGEDLLVPATRRAKRGKLGYALRFHLGSGVRVGLGPKKKGAGIALDDGSRWQFRVSEGELALEESIWVDGCGKPHPIQQLVLAGMVSRGGGSFSWLLKRMD